MADGAFNITTVGEMMLGGLELPLNPPPVRWPQRVAPDEFIAAINRKRILDRLLFEIRARRRRRVPPRKMQSVIEVGFGLAGTHDASRLQQFFR